jgi:hypothetical protein
MPESAESMTSYQYAGNDPVNMNDPMGDLLNPARMSHPDTQIGQTFIPQIRNTDGYDDDEDQGDAALDYYLNVTTQQGAGGGFTSEEQVQETVDYLFNETPFGGTSNSYNNMVEFTTRAAQLGYGYAEYRANGGTQSFNQVLLNYAGQTMNTSYVENQLSNGSTATASLEAEGTPDYTVDDDDDPYVYLGTLRHIAVDATHPVPATGIASTQVDAMCVFFAMQYDYAYFGQNYKAGLIANDYSKESGIPLTTLLFNGVHASSNPADDQFLNLMTSFFYGRTPNSMTDLEENAGINPILSGIPAVGLNSGHEVWVTGFNANNSFQYYDPELGTYSSTRQLIAPFITTGIK